MDLETVMAKLDESPGNYIDALRTVARQHKHINGLNDIVTNLGESIQTIRIIVKYLALDLEATQRERDMLRTELEDQL